MLYFFSQEVFKLQGHFSWVKNVEYHKPTKQLVSAGFDNHIFAWDINK